MKKSKCIYIAVLMLIAFSCDDELGSNEPLVSKDYIDVASSLSLLGDGQETELRITSNCNWSVSYSAVWLSVTPSSGNSSEAVKVSAGKNSTGQERSVTLTVQAGTAPARSVVVTQGKGSEEAVAKTLSANTTSLSFGATETSKTFTISSNTNWTISKPEWCIVSVSSGTGNGDVVVIATENPNKEQRNGQIVVTGEGVSPVSISVSQEGKDTSNSQEPGADDNLPPS